MTDQWVDVHPQQDEWQDITTRTPADASPEMKDAQWGAANPYLRAGQNIASQSLVNPLVQAINGISPAINGLDKLEGNNFRIPQIQGPDMSNAPIAAKVLGDVAGGGAQGLLATAMGGGNPILGYGAMSGLGAFGEGKPVVPAVIGGAASAIPQMIAGKMGSSLASSAAKPIGGMMAKYAPNVGTALGMGGASAAQAAMTGGNPVIAGATGATFGLMSPMNPMGAPRTVSPEQYDSLLDQGAEKYRNVLNPGKGIINKVEIKSGNDIDDSMRLAAKEGLVINSNEGKLDNRSAIDQLKAAVAPMYDEQNKILASNASKQFNLQDLADQVNSGLAKTTKSASDLSSAQGKVQNEIDAEILRHGTKITDADGNITYDPRVDGQTLNMIKQGMWGKSYNPLEPNANDSARAIGYAAKDAIEKAYPLDTIKENNANIGQYLQLQKILESTHGQGIQGGKIGKYASQATGAITGGLVSSHLPLLGEVAGPMAGREIGQRVHDIINDPARITGDWAKQIKNVSVSNPNPIELRRPGAVTPEVMNAPQTSMNPITLGLPNKSNYNMPGYKESSPTILSGPKGTPDVKSPPSDYLRQRENMPNKINVPVGKSESSNPIPMNGRSASSMNPINFPPKTEASNGSAQPNKRAQFDMSKGGTPQGLPEPIVTPPLGTQEHAQAFPQSQFNPLKTVQQALSAAKEKLSSEKGSASVGGESTEDMKALLKSYQQRMNEPDVQKDASTKKDLQVKMELLSRKIKDASNNPLASVAGATMLGAASVFHPTTSQAQTVKDPDRLKLTANKYIMKNEGWKPSMYLDTNGHKTVGYGFKEGGMAWKYVPDAVKQGRRAMTKAEGMTAFNKAYPDAVASAHSFAGNAWDNLSVNQQKSLIDMSWQMGNIAFSKLKAALQSGNYNTASREIMNSKYAKKDAPQRALQNSILMQQ